MEILYIFENYISCEFSFGAYWKTIQITKTISEFEERSLELYKIKQARNKELEKKNRTKHSRAVGHEYKSLTYIQQNKYLKR